MDPSIKNIQNPFLLSSSKDQTMKFRSLFKFREPKKVATHPWDFACKFPKTESFRASEEDGYKSMNSVFLVAGTDSFSDRWFSNTSEPSTEISLSEDSGESIELNLKGLSSERFFIEPGDTKSILEEAREKTSGGGLFRWEQSVFMAMDSEDPYLDFRVSMEEMVEAHGIREWWCLEELLQWYLKVNGKKTHGFIVGAFVDLLISIVSSGEEDVEEEDVDVGEENFCLEVFYQEPIKKNKEAFDQEK